jgi:WD40 repeat protein
VEGKNKLVISGGDSALRDDNKGTLRFWPYDQPSGDPVPTTQQGVLSLVIVKNGQLDGQLVSGSEDGTLKFFPLPEEAIRAACQQVKEHPLLKFPKTYAQQKAQHTCKSRGYL